MFLWCFYFSLKKSVGLYFSLMIVQVPTLGVNTPLIKGDNLDTVHDASLELAAPGSCWWEGVGQRFMSPEGAESICWCAQLYLAWVVHTSSCLEEVSLYFSSQRREQRPRHLPTNTFGHWVDTVTGITETFCPFLPMSICSSGRGHQLSRVLSRDTNAGASGRSLDYKDIKLFPDCASFKNWCELQPSRADCSGHTLHLVCELWVASPFSRGESCGQEARKPGFCPCLILPLLLLPCPSIQVHAFLERDRLQVDLRLRTLTWVGQATLATI